MLKVRQERKPISLFVTYTTQWTMEAEMQLNKNEQVFKVDLALLVLKCVLS
jgi:hypothetical protein